MKFSIVTLAFRQRKYLKEAMDSVFNQDYPDIEYIVVEPGSNDGSREIIEEYGDEWHARSLNRIRVQPTD